MSDEWDDLELDDDMMDGFDDYDDYDNPGSSEGKRDPILTVAAGALEEATSIDSAIKVSSIVAKNALPKGFGTAIDDIDDVSKEVVNLYDKAKTELKEPIRDVKMFLNKTVGSSEMIPDGIRKKIYDATKEEEEEFSDSVDPRLLEIQEATNRIFAQQAVADEQSAEANRSIDKAKFEATAATSVETNNLLRKVCAFNGSIVSEFYKKTLELQFRQYFTAKDALEEHRASSKDMLSYLEAIKQNTGLPDIQKTLMSEEYMQSIQDRMTDGFGETAAEYMSGFTDKLKENIMGKLRDVGDFVGEIASGGVDIIDAMGTVDELDADSKNELIGSTVAGVAVPGLAKSAAKRLAKLLKDNPQLAEKSNNLLYLSRNFPMVLDDWLGKRDDSWIVEQLLDVIPEFGGSAISIGRDLGADGLTAMSFDQLSHTTLNEVIPGYLSRMLRVLEEIRSGTDQDRTVFDHDGQQFVQMGELKDRVGQRLGKGSDTSTKQYAADRILTRVDPKAELSEEERIELMRVLTKDAGAGELFSLARYADPSMFEGSGSTKIAQAFSDLDSGDSVTRSEDMLHLSDAARDLSSGYRETSQFINRLNAFGMNDVVRELGLVGNDKDGKLVVDNESVVRQMVSGLNLSGNYEGMDLSTLESLKKEEDKRKKEEKEGKRKKRATTADDIVTPETPDDAEDTQDSLFSRVLDQVNSKTVEEMQKTFSDAVTRVAESETAKTASTYYNDAKTRVVEHESVQNAITQAEEAKKTVLANESVSKAIEDYEATKSTILADDRVQSVTGAIDEKRKEAEELVDRVKKDGLKATAEKTYKDVSEKASEALTEENIKATLSSKAEKLKEEVTLNTNRIIDTVSNITVEDVENFKSKTSEELVKKVTEFVEREDVQVINKDVRELINSKIEALPSKEEAKLYVEKLANDEGFRKEEFENAVNSGEQIYTEAMENVTQKASELVTPVQQSESYKRIEELAKEQKAKLDAKMDEVKQSETYQQYAPMFTYDNIVPDSFKARIDDYKRDGTFDYGNVKARVTESANSVVQRAEAVRDNIKNADYSDLTDLTDFTKAGEVVDNMVKDVSTLVSGGLEGIRETLQHIGSPDYIRSVISISKEMDDSSDVLQNATTPAEHIVQLEEEKYSLTPDVVDKIIGAVSKLASDIPEQMMLKMFEDSGDGVKALPVTITGAHTDQGIGWTQLMESNASGHQMIAESVTAMHSSLAEILVDGENTSLVGSVTSRISNLISGTLTGAGNFAKSYVQGVGNMGASLLGASGNVISKVAGAVSAGIGNTMFSGRSDIYVKGQTKPALTAKGLINGWYTDVNTDKVVRNLDDITGSVVDQNGNVVVTDEEANEGLFTLDKGGLGGIARMISIPLTAAYNLQRDALGAVFSVPAKMISLVKGVFDKPFDVYVGGESSPRLLSVIFKNGGYISAATGKPLSHPNDIDGEVKDRNGNVVLSNDDIKNGLYNRHGIQVGSSRLLAYAKKIGTFGFDATIGLGAKVVKGTLGAASAVVGGVTNAVSSVAGGSYDLLYNLLVGRSGGPNLTGDVGRLDDIYKFMLARWPLDGKSSVESVIAQQEEILNELRSDNPDVNDADGDGDRDGGWMDILSRRNEEQTPGAIPDSNDAPQEEEKSKNGLDKIITAILGGLSSLGGVFTAGIGTLGSLLMGSKVIGALKSRFGFGDALDVADTFSDLAPDGNGTPRPTPHSSGGGSRMGRMVNRLKGWGGAALDIAKTGVGKVRAATGLAEGGAVANRVGQAANAARAVGSNVASRVATSSVGQTAMRAGAQATAARTAAGAVGRRVATKVATVAAGRVALKAGALLLGPVGAVLGAGMLMYDAYQGINYLIDHADLEPIERLRYMQYGVPVEDSDFIALVRNLEDGLIGEIEYGKKAKIGVNLKEVVLKHAEDFGVNLDDVNQVAGFGDWVSKRFIPVFMTHATAVYNIDDSVDLLDIDDEMKEDDKPKFIKAVQFKKEYLAKNPIYSVNASPVPGKQVVTGSDAITAYIGTLLAKYGQSPGEQSSVPEQVKEGVPKPSEQAKETLKASGAKTNVKTLGGDATKVKVKTKLDTPEAAKDQVKYKGGIYTSTDYGTAVMSEVDGVITSRHYEKTKGRTLTVEDVNGKIHEYSSLGSFSNKRVGTSVSKGEPLGTSGIGRNGKPDGFLYKVKQGKSTDNLVNKQTVKLQAGIIGRAGEEANSTSELNGVKTTMTGGVVKQSGSKYNTDDVQMKSEVKAKRKEQERAEQRTVGLVNATAVSTARSLTKREKEEQLNFYEQTSIEQRDRMLHNQGLMFELLTMVTETITGEEVTIGSIGEPKGATTARKTNSFQDPVSLRKNRQ